MKVKVKMKMRTLVGFIGSLNKDVNACVFSRVYIYFFINLFLDSHFPHMSNTAASISMGKVILPLVIYNFVL